MADSDGTGMSLLFSRKKISLFLLCVLLFSFIAFSTLFASELPRRTVKIGWFEYSGYQHTTQAGALYGYNNEFYQKIAQTAGWNVEFVSGTLAVLYDKLLNGEIDILGCLPMTKDYSEECDSVDMGATISHYSLFAPLESMFAYEDYRMFDGIRVGISSGTDDTPFLKYSAENNFSAELLRYGTDEELMAAVERGDVDAGMSSEYISYRNMRIIAKFDPKPLYFLVSKENTGVFSELTNAVNYIKLEYPHYETDLAKKYMPEFFGDFMLTMEEKEFISSCEKFYVVCSESWKPFETIENGRFSGIIADVYKEISDMTGLEFAFRSGSKQYDGNADIISSIEHSFNLNGGRGYSATDAFLHLPLSLITREDGVAIGGLAATTFDFYSYDRLGYSFVIYRTAEACFEALISGAVDALVINTYSSNAMMTDGAYGGLKAEPLPGITLSLAAAINNELDPMLISIINKALSFISEERMNEIIVRNTAITQKNGFVESLNDIPPYIIIFFATILLTIIIILAILIIIRLKNEKNIQKLLDTDRLTGLLNRRGFESAVHDSLMRAPKNLLFSMVAMDIGHFEMYNSLYGFSRGDELLCTIAGVLKDECGEYELCARISADNFACLMYGENIDAIIARTAEISSNVKSASGNNSLLFSYGLREIRDRTLSVGTMYDRAVIAKRTIKGNYNRNVAVYDDEFYHKQAEDKMLTDSMESALENNEFKAVYQPKYDTKTQRIVGAEALVRWVRPDGKIISPNRFISLFEGNGQISKLDNYMFKTVCRFLRDMVKKGISPPPISVNFSRAHLYELDFAENLLKTAKEHQIPSTLLEIELTESAFINNQDLLIKIIADLHDRGFLVSIDDFGSGYSSLNMIKDVEFDIMKLDRGFLSSTEDNQRATDIIKCMIELANSLGIETLAEGVETEEQYKFLYDIGCNMIQGYYFSRPVDGDKLVEMMINQSDL